MMRWDTRLGGGERRKSKTHEDVESFQRAKKKPVYECTLGTLGALYYNVKTTPQYLLLILPLSSVPSLPI